MRMPKPVKATKTVAISADPQDRSIKRMLAAMEAFMAADSANDAVAPQKRAA